MIRIRLLWVGLVVQANVLPALEVDAEIDGLLQ